MGQDQDPYDDAGAFTPYQPAAQPQSETPEPPPPGETPYVPYGAPAPPPGPAAPYYAVTIATPRRSRALPWVIGIGILVLLCGGAVAGVVAAVDGLDIMPGGDEVYVNDLDEGQCLSGAGFDPESDEGVTNLEVTPCDEAHDAQVLAINKLDRREVDAYDFDSSQNAGDMCNPSFSAEQKALFRDDTYYLIAFTETRDPEVGDQVACLVVRGDGGPIRGFLPASDGVTG